MAKYCHKDTWLKHNIMITQETVNIKANNYLYTKMTLNGQSGKANIKVRMLYYVTQNRVGLNREREREGGVGGGGGGGVANKYTFMIQ